MVVVGGGVTGLVAARRLAPAHDVIVFEAAGRFGGKLRTAEFGGHPLDLGPDAFITRDRSAVGLCEELGLGDALLAPASSGAALFARGQIRPLPAGLVLGVPTDLVQLWRSGVMRRRGVLRAAADLVLPGLCAPGDLVERADSGAGDPTVAEVLGRRLGREALATLIDPLIGGINAGAVEALSFVAAAPSLAARVAGRHSLVRALRTRGHASVDSATRATHDPSELPMFLGLAQGMGQLVERLSAACSDAGVTLHSGASVERVARSSDEALPWSVEVGGETIPADGLVLATPAFVSAELLADASDALARECAAIPYAGVAVVTLAFPQVAVPWATTAALAPPGAARVNAPGPANRLPGNGVIVARSETALVTAATFTSTKWPRSAAPDEVVIRASLGRHQDPRALELDDDALVERAAREVSAMLALSAPPRATKLQRWPKSFPQYVSGHRARIGRIAALSAQLPAFALAGAAYGGIGIPACVASAEAAAQRVAAALAGRARA